MIKIFQFILILSVLILKYEISFAQTQNFNSANTNAEEVHRNAAMFVDHMTNGERQFAMAFKGGLLLELGRKGHSGYRLYISGALAKNFSKGSLGTILNYQVDLVLYTSGIGSSILPSERNKMNIEFRNHIGVVAGINDNDNNVWGRPLNPNIGDSNSIFSDPFDYSFQLGTAFITGVNHNRSQQLGFFKLGLGFFELFYMNDGPPFGAIGLGDSGDRFWTGVGGIGLYYIDPNLDLTSAELRYSRYTGDEPFLYSLSTYMRMNYLPHKDGKVQYFNKGRYQYRFGFRNTAYVGFNIYQPKNTDIQRIIHDGVYALHSNPTKRYFTFFGQFLYNQTYLFD